MSEILVAKRSLRSVVINPKRISIARRNARKNFLPKQTANNQRQKFESERKQPAITPALRREQLKKTDECDTLVLTEAFDDIESKAERGRLLRLSTLKPKQDSNISTPKPDPISPNSINTTKRIVRIVDREKGGRSLDIQLERPKFVSIGVQVGSPSPQFASRAPKPFAPAPKPLPPLRSYWTHKVNLPYPPEQNSQQIHSQPLSVPQPFQQQQFVPPSNQFGPPQYFTTQVAPQQYQQPTYEAVYEPVYQVPFYQRPALSRKQRRNANKREKYIQRH